ncbi:MAG: ATP-binding protein [Acidobacteriota bacterium]
MPLTAEAERKLTEKIQSLTEKLLETFEELNLVYDLTEIFTSSSSIDQTIQNLAKLAIERLEAEGGWVVLRDERSGRVHTVALHGVEGEVAHELNAQIVTRVVDTGRPSLHNDLRTMPYYRPEMNLRAFLAVPLLVRNKILGAICICRRSSDEIFTSGDQKMLTVMARQGATAIEKHKLEKKLLDVERLAVIGEFAARVAHEVRNPLTSIKGFTFLIGRPKTTPEQIGQYTSLIIEEIDRMDRIIKDLLHFSRKGVLHAREHSIEEVIDRAVTLTESQRLDAGVEIDRRSSCDGVRLMIDGERMLQVFLNLIINALHAMPAGGKLRVESRAEDREVAVEVTDTGCGIPQDQVESIFDPFFTTKETGTGLGLAIAKRILEEHKGDIAVESIEGEGTRFTVRLPMETDLKPFNPTE